VASRALALLLAGLAAACASPAPLPPAPEIDASLVARDATWLADDAREGRGAGSRGLAEAAEYLARGFREAGLAPGAPGGGYLQRFEMPVAIRVLRQELAAGGATLGPGDFGAFLASASAEAAGELVFAGYGITSPHDGWDDYAGLPVEGRVVLVLDDRPVGPQGPLGGAGGVAFLLRREKIANARRHGAAAVLIAPSAAEQAPVPGEQSPEAANPTVQSSGIPALWLSRPAAERIVAAAGGASLAELQAGIDAAFRPASRALGGLRAALAVEIERRRGEAANVIAVREGADPQLAREALVIGAHYDHLGRGDHGSLAADRIGEVHNGADDNASGAAGLLALARTFGAAPPTRRTLVLAAFSGEELGLFGSRAYAEDPAVPLGDTVAMLNLDMIGRLRDGELSVFGTGSAEGFPELALRAGEGLGLALRLGGDGYAPSDQTTFYARGVPVLFFFTGAHAEYHTPDDDANLLNAEGQARVLEVVYRAAQALLEDEGRPRLIAAPAPAERGDGPGYGPYLGTVPDFVPTPGPGVRIQAVRPDSPAARAGLRAGDRIVAFDGASVESLEEFAALLFASRAGARVEIEVLRDGERLLLEATLGRRR